MCVCKHFIFKEFYDLNRLIKLSFKYIFLNDISPHFKFLLSTERLYIYIYIYIYIYFFFLNEIKRINNKKKKKIHSLL